MYVWLGELELLTSMLLAKSMEMEVFLHLLLHPPCLSGWCLRPTDEPTECLSKSQKPFSRKHNQAIVVDATMTDPRAHLNVQATATALASCAQSMYEELQTGRPDTERLERSQFLYHFWLKKLQEAVAANVVPAGRDPAQPTGS